MPIIQELPLLTPARETLLTIGGFDGVHLGHQRLIQALIARARERGLMSGVVTFHRHPRMILNTPDKITYLASVEERLAFLRSLGVDHPVVLTFTEEVARLGAREFVHLLMEHLKMRGLVVGPGFALGRGREGDIPYLTALGQELGFTLDVVAPVSLEGRLVSSSAVRQALTEGDMETVNRFLGRPFALEGVVVRGAGRGQSLGFPTANLALALDQALPGDGIYVMRAYVGGRGGAYHPAVANIGRRPTFDGGETLVEVHLLDFAGDLYGQTLRVEVISRLRPERKFAGPQPLVAQMKRDVAQARAILEGEGSH
ncbi:MAG: bifunctional riboflavin kinase/FAD synthetase [Chloroflexi bacterium]|nr:bifunctional riboflavin kinase/FAD synthetase [Chloroflexota bacterium]